MDLRIYVTGPEFQDNSALDATIEILHSYDTILKTCFEKAVAKHDVISTSRPRLKLENARPGSLDVNLAVEFAAAIAPMAPSIFGYAWDIFKTSYELVKVAVQYFNRRDQPIQITINNSPGATVIQGDGNNIVSRDALEVAQRHHGDYYKLADLVRRGRADTVEIEAPQVDQSTSPRLLIDNTNQNDFKVRAVESADDHPVEFECNIYRLNTKTRKGSLEYLLGEEGPTNYPFVVHADVLDDCINALKEPVVKVTATRDVEVNALGETKIKRFHLLGFQPAEPAIDSRPQPAA